MSRMGDELILELAASLGGLNKTAGKDKDDKEDKKDKKDDKCPGCGKPSQFCTKKDCGKEDKKDKKDSKDKKDKKDKKDAKKEAVMSVISGLSKLAGELDDLGAEEASSLVDDALKVIVQNLEATKSE